MAPTIAFAVLAFLAALGLLVVLLRDGGPQRFIASIFDTIARTLARLLHREG